MDIKLEKKPWYVRYRYRLIGGVLVLAGLVYVIVLASGPRRLRVKLETVQTSEVSNADFREYVDVEGVVQPIMTLMVNTLEAGNVERIVAEDGKLMKQGDTIMVLTNPDLTLILISHHLSAARRAQFDRVYELAPVTQ